jgi:hypothetical protein
MADDVIDVCREHAAGLGLDIGIKGKNEVNSRYIGSEKSPRMLRIYRKDLQDETYARDFGPLMRLELVMRDRYAWAFWQAWAESERAGYDTAAGWVEYMTGFEIVPGGGEYRDVRPKRRSPAAKRVASLVSQYAVHLLAAEAAGVDLLTLASESLSRRGRHAEGRLVALSEELQGIGDVDECMAAVRLCL